jgi:hypothetical protein
LIFNNLSAGSKTKTVANKYMAIRNNLRNIYFPITILIIALRVILK